MLNKSNSTQQVKTSGNNNGVHLLVVIQTTPTGSNTNNTTTQVASPQGSTLPPTTMNSMNAQQFRRMINSSNRVSVVSDQYGITTTRSMTEQPSLRRDVKKRKRVQPEESELKVDVSPQVFTSKRIDACQYEVSAVVNKSTRTKQYTISVSNNGDMIKFKPIHLSHTSKEMQVLSTLNQNNFPSQDFQENYDWSCGDKTQGLHLLVLETEGGDKLGIVCDTDNIHETKIVEGEKKRSTLLDNFYHFQFGEDESGNFDLIAILRLCLGHLDDLHGFFSDLTELIKFEAVRGKGDTNVANSTQNTVAMRSACNDPPFENIIAKVDGL